MLLTLSATQHLNTLDDILRLNGYPQNSIEQAKGPQNPQRNPQPANTEWSYLKIRYISERLNHGITNIFRKENIPVRIAHKSYTLRQALSHTSTERKCTRDKCPISQTGLCLRRNAVYQLTSNSCDQQYIGSSKTRFIHDLVKEYVDNENSSNVSIPAKTKTMNALRSRAKTTPLIYAFMKHFTLESASLHSVPGRNVVNSQTFYFSILETILKRFQMSFVQRHSIIRALYSIHSIFLQLSYMQWNPVNTDTKGTSHSVRIIRVSVVSGLSEKTSGTHVLLI